MIVDVLMLHFSGTSISKMIRCNCAQQFKGAIMEAFTKCLRLEVTFATPYHHESLGDVERAQQTFQAILKGFLKDHERN